MTEQKQTMQTMDTDLPAELRELEQLLSSLTPSALPEKTADLISVSVQASVPAGDAPADQEGLDQEGLEKLERHLGQISPATMRTDVLSRMVKAMDGWHEHVPVEEKVVSFSDQPVACEPVKKQSGNMIAAAAAMALLGAATALVVPHFSAENDHSPGIANASSSAPQVVNRDEITISSQPKAKEAWLVPDSLSHRVINTADRGIVMAGNETPHRCIRLDSMETIKMEDEEGREIIIDRPSIRYVLIPVETN